MDVLKTRPGIHESISINEKNFTEKTKKQKPYYIRKEKNKIRCHAVCPLCDNPIQIIGLYKKEEESKVRPYGRHYKGNIYGLARYDQISYENCPYSDPNHPNGNVRRPPADPTAQALYQIMRDEFDKMIYVLGKSLGMHIAIGFADKLLRSWKANEGWRYYESTYANLPYMLLYAEPAYSMFGRILPKDGEIHQELLCSGKNFVFEENRKDYVKIKQKEGKFLDATFLLEDHQYVQYGEHLTETYQMKIIEGNDTIYEKTIEVEENSLKKLSVNWRDTKRNHKLRELAQNVLK